MGYARLLPVSPRRDLGSLPVPDEDFKLQFKAQSRFLAEKRKVAKVVIDTLVLKHNAHRLSAAA
jgi:hypothetical protein